MTKGFKAACPERFFDMGIAECNMIGVAAGMATCGYKPFTNTFAMFAAGRAWEQVRNSIGYPHLNVKVVGSPRRSVRRRGRRDPPVHRGLRHHARHPRHDGPLPLRRPRDACWPSRLCSSTTARPTCAWAAWRSRPSPTRSPATGSSWARASRCVTARDVTIIATGMMVQMALKAARAAGRGGRLRPRHRHAHHQAAR